MIKACWHRRGWCLSWWNPLKAPWRSAILWITKKGVPAFPFPSSVPIPFMYERNFLINTYPTPTVDGSEILQGPPLKPWCVRWKCWESQTGGSGKSFLKNNVSHHGKAQNPGILRWFCLIPVYKPYMNWIGLMREWWIWECIFENKGKVYRRYISMMTSCS